jgi:predicted RNA-binding Zn ribbon-like protein
MPDAAPSPPDLVERLQAIAVNPRTANRKLDFWFTPKQVARGLEAAKVRFAVLWISNIRSGVEVWEAIEAAFLATVGEGK